MFSFLYHYKDFYLTWLYRSNTSGYLIRSRNCLPLAATCVPPSPRFFVVGSVLLDILFFVLTIIVDVLVKVWCTSSYICGIFYFKFNGIDKIYLVIKLKIIQCKDIIYIVNRPRLLNTINANLKEKSFQKFFDSHPVWWMWFSINSWYCNGYQLYPCSHIPVPLFVWIRYHAVASKIPVL
jgi:hypothetical protein